MRLKRIHSDIATSFEFSTVPCSLDLRPVHLLVYHPSSLDIVHKSVVHVVSTVSVRGNHICPRSQRPLFRIRLVKRVLSYSVLDLLN